MSANKSIPCSLSSELHCHYRLSGSWGRERFLPLARCTHRGLLQSPAYLAHTFTVSLSPRDTSRFPSYYRPQSSRITNPPNGTVPFDSFLQLRGNVRLLLSYTSYHFLPPAVPSPGCLSLFPSLRDTFIESSMSIRMYAVDASDFHLPFL